MKIGIDVSQLAFEQTGVARYLGSMLRKLLDINQKNTYVLFFSSLRRNPPLLLAELAKKQNVTFKRFYFPPTILDLMWNIFHIVPVEWLIGKIDIFLSSDWTQPPTNAKKTTILYDLIPSIVPDETDATIIKVQKRRISWVKKEIDIVICISEATKKDAMEILGIEEKRLKVIYPGI